MGSALLEGMDAAVVVHHFPLAVEKTQTEAAEIYTEVIHNGSADEGCDRGAQAWSFIR